MNTLHPFVVGLAGLLLAVQGGFILHHLRRIRMDMTALATSLNSVSDQLTKATAEIVAAVASSGNTTPEVDAAVAKLQTLAQALDDLNRDVAAPPAP